MVYIYGFDPCVPPSAKYSGLGWTGLGACCSSEDR